MSDFNFGGSQISRNEIFQMIIRVSLASVVTYFSVKWMMKQIDPTSKNKRKAKIRAEEQLKRLAKGSNFELKTQTLNDYELMIASHLVVPDDIPISWKDIAGLDSVIQELRESVVLPVRHRDLFNQSKLWEAPKGVLLHGPPGCGKTLIAKATAKEAGMRFINLDVAMLTDKWYGESQKLASAVFSLAVKLEPCIVFIDEIDSFLRNRSTNDHEATAMMKTQFMMMWDGLSTRAGSTVIVMGATNRPQDLDKAILRRMPAQFHIGLPTDAQRLQILKLVLELENISESVDFNRLSKLTKGFSGSDLREMCRNASVYRMRQFMRDNESAINAAENTEEFHDATSSDLLAISMEDMLRSYERMKESKKHTQNLFVENHIELD
ncbi:outer mitochondrial transmembrane helix translocase-like [Episyrphus balteatus]|uniref:outer mitochondrial transmembrane helix translocase-like n=1 Tax=Episyrphus balteatus TaxID=286459 RepID=UPI002486BB61|nr:outer mitochondrial transmembrane helix translocase-like [Episyrphus balteatus]